MKKPPFLRTEYNYDMNAAGDESALDTGTQGGAKQSFKDEVDINTIVKRFGIGYEIPESLRLPQYGDFTGINDFHMAMNSVAVANENFDKLPAHVRAKFHNDTGEFVEFATNPSNREELKKMGLLSPEAIQRDQDAQDALLAEAATPPPSILKKPRKSSSEPSEQ